MQWPGSGAARHAEYFPRKLPRFVRNFMEGSISVESCAAFRCRREGSEFSRPRGAHLLKSHAHHSHHRRLRDLLAAFKRPAFVPTMGNLHDGHIALVEQAKRMGDVTVASIFVNRLQFLPHEDFDTYPRTWDSDCSRLTAAGCDVLFSPNERELYRSHKPIKCTHLPNWRTYWRGIFAPVFIGVSTVVMKLFACVQPVSRYSAKRLPAAHDHPSHGAAVCLTHRHRGKPAGHAMGWRCHHATVTSRHPSAKNRRNSIVRWKLWLLSGEPATRTWRQSKPGR